VHRPLSRTFRVYREKLTAPLCARRRKRLSSAHGKEPQPQLPGDQPSEAIEKVRAIHDKDRRNKVPKEVIAKHLGYAGLNGASLTVISALSKYGSLR